MSISKTLKRSERAGNMDTVIGICNFAGQLADAGEYANAAQAMGNWWHGVGVRPGVDDLPVGKKASILSRIGTLSGWLGSMQQVPGSQEKAKDLISEAANLFEAINDYQNWAETRSDLAVCYWREGAFDEARIILQDVLESEFTLTAELQGKLLLRLVNTEISTKHYRKAMSLIDRATPLIENTDNYLLRGKLYFHKALVLRNLGEDENKSDLLLAAANYYKQAGVYYKKAKHVLFDANVENNLGNVYRLLGDFKNTHAHLDKAIYLYIKLKDQARAALVYENKAQAYLAEQQVKDAISAANTSVAMVRKGGEQSLLAESLTTLGVVLSRGGDIGEAVNSFTEAKETALMVGDREGAGNAVLTQIEELQAELTPADFRSLYLEAAELLENSPKTSTVDRLQKIAKKQFENIDNFISFSEDENFTEEENFTPLVIWEDFSLPDAVLIYERDIIMKALTETGGRITKAAQLLGLSHQNLSLILQQRHRGLKKLCAPRKPRSATKTKTH
jgi:tetratricopeptide (TPR) repeat protein